MIDGEPTDNNFAEFEAAATSGEPVAEPAAAPPEAVEPDEPAETPEPDETSEIEAEEGDKPEKRRSKPAHQRIAELTAKLRQAERDLDASRKPADEGVRDQAAPSSIDRPDPNAKNDDGSDKYEFGEADPNYLADLTDYKVEAKLTEREAKTAAEAQKNHASEVITNLDNQWKEKATAAAEKYPDFNEVVLESAAAGEWECGMLMSMAISASEQGADIAYHLAQNPKEAAELNKLAQTDPMEAARRFGRMEARFETQTEKVVSIKPTNAPEPPQNRARGAAGRFEVGGDTTDFAAFERKANGR